MRGRVNSISHCGWRVLFAACLLAAPAHGQSPAPKPGARAASGPHAKISAAQAETLFRSVDTILRYDSQDTALPIRQPVKRKLITRDEVLAYLRQQMHDDKDTARLERSAVELEKLGMLPPHFDLESFLFRLLGEQIAGFYDDKTKTVNLLDWVDADEQKPVLAHELCHALQDQFQNARGVVLDKWENAGPDDIPKNVAEDREAVRYDETDTAREAVLEGQAMVTYLDWGMEGRGQTLRTLPMIQPQVLSGAAAKDPDSPVLDSAPLVLRESLLFPYQDGLIFEQYLLKNRGTDAAFADVLKRPPDSSWEILHPEAYLKGVRAPVLAMPDLHPLLDREWAPYDVGVMGALDVRMLCEALADAGAGADAALAWDGGVYYAAQSRALDLAASAATPGDTGSVALVYLSRWKTAKAAAVFAKIYRDSLPHRYPGLISLEKTPERTVDQTGEGPIVVAQQDRYVFLSHTLPVPLAGHVMTAMLAAQSISGKPANSAAASTPELASPLRAALARAGTLRAAAILSGAGR